MTDVIIRVPPYTYIHILDTNTNITRVVVGPHTHTRQEHEKLIVGPEKCVTVPPRHFIKIKNPVLRDADGNVITDQYGQAKLRFGDEEYRIHASETLEPFPLFPGEKKIGAISKLLVVEKNEALHLRASREIESREAGEEFLFHGPATYIPNVAIEEIGLIKATVVKHSEALRLKAIRKHVDADGIERKAGESYLMRRTGAYLKSIDEEIVEKVKAFVLTDKLAIHLSALKTFTDAYGIVRRAGEEWLVTSEMAEQHIPDVYEEFKKSVQITTLSSRQYATVVNPWVDGAKRLGSRELRKGECSFFLQPGETLLNGICDVIVLSEDEALLLKATEAFVEDPVDGGELVASTPSSDGSEVIVSGASRIQRQPGDIWMVFGPISYVPPTQVEIVETRKSIPLDKQEGIYVRDKKSGLVRAVIGITYMLNENEELWKKELPSEVEELLEKQALGQVFVKPCEYGGSPEDAYSVASFDGPSKSRDKTRVVTFRVPHNAAVQIYDFKSKKCRCVMGPNLVTLMPDEQFTTLSLSGACPKRPGVINSLSLMLGPDFMRDEVLVETSDHARLRLTLAYNWMFEVDEDDPSHIFCVRDFTGDSCKALASRIRGAVASVSFDVFHKNSAKIIRGSVFGVDNASGKVGDCLRFAANGLVISNIDIQSVEPVDASTRESLQKSVQLAIAITTQSQEAKARHEAHREEEEAKGALERQKLINEAQSESQRKELLKLKAASNAVTALEASRAEAQAAAERQRIEAEAQVARAKLMAEAKTIELEMLAREQENRLKFEKEMSELEVTKKKELAAIEADKFRQVVDAIGKETIESIARAGPELQAKLLGGLGLKGYLVTDGKSPINLFSTAKGLIDQAGAGADV